jgi:hypothetical protein
MRTALLLGVLLFVLNLGLEIRLMRHQVPWTCSDPPGDSQDHDSMALNLLCGRCVGVIANDPEWRQPYEQCDQQGTYDVILQRTGSV